LEDPLLQALKRDIESIDLERHNAFRAFDAFTGIERKNRTKRMRQSSKMQTSFSSFWGESFAFAYDSVKGDKFRSFLSLLV